MKADYENYASDLRETVRHENDLTNHRINWLVLLNGLAFASIGLLWDKDGVRLVLLTLTGMGFSVSLSCWFALLGGHEAHRTLVRLWNSRSVPPTDIAPISARSDCDTTGAFKKRWFDKFWFLCPWHCIPIIFMIVWSVVGYTITQLPPRDGGGERSAQVQQEGKPVDTENTQNKSSKEQVKGAKPAVLSESK